MDRVRPASDGLLANRTEKCTMDSKMIGKLTTHNERVSTDLCFMGKDL